MTWRAALPERDERVLDAAESCYELKGWRNATMEEVAGIAGVSRAYLYDHFRSKDGLLRAVMIRRAAALMERARPFILGQTSLDDALVAGILLGVKLARADRYVRQLLSANCDTTGDRSPANVTMALSAADYLWRPVLERAHRRNELRSDLDVDDAIDWIALVAMGLLAVGDARAATDRIHERQLRALLVPAILREDPDTIRDGRRQL